MIGKMGSSFPRLSPEKTVQLNASQILLFFPFLQEYCTDLVSHSLSDVGNLTIKTDLAEPSFCILSPLLIFILPPYQIEHLQYMHSTKSEVWVHRAKSS